jgi:hypothetical protein
LVILGSFLESDPKRVALRLAASKFDWTISWRAANVAENRAIHARIGVRHALVTRTIQRAGAPLRFRSLGVGKINSSGVGRQL